MKATYFSVDTTPNVRVVDAVRASICIPILMRPVRIGDEFYIDGNITHGLPMRHIDERVSKDSIIIICLFQTTSGKPLLDMSKLRNKYKPASSCEFASDQLTFIGSYLLTVMNTVNENHQLGHIMKLMYPNYIEIRDIPVNLIDLVSDENNVHVKPTSAETVDLCVAHGYKIMHDFIKSKHEHKHELKHERKHKHEH
jgi:predicted acylesterase/phospholipase RssA